MQVLVFANLISRFHPNLKPDFHQTLTFQGFEIPVFVRILENVLPPTYYERGEVVSGFRNRLAVPKPSSR